jgi:sucrose-6-phosphate hydrolase SacC (GH32 family)
VTPTVLTLRFFLDASVVELFVDDRVCISERIYLGKPSLEATLTSPEPVRLVAYKRWLMQSIYPSS